MKAHVNRPAATIAILAAFGLSSGCGKGGQPRADAPAKAAPATARASSPPAEPLEATRARAFAEAVNLRPTDLPGFSAVPKHGESESPTERQLGNDMLRCAGGLGGSRGLGELGSGAYQRQIGLFNGSVSSAVSFSRSAAAASHELSTMRSARARGCLGHYIDRIFSRGRYAGRFKRVSLTQGSPPAPGTSGGFGWRITAAISASAVRIPFYVDVLGFVYGSAEVTLVSTGVPNPFPAAGEERLFSLLLERARAHLP